MIKTYKYKEPFKKEEVCIGTFKDSSQTEYVIFLTCDPCTVNLCVNLCCPHGQVLKDVKGDVVEREHRCDALPEAKKDCQSHDENELQRISDTWKESLEFLVQDEKQIIFLGSQNYFSCPGKRSIVPAEYLFGPQDMILQKNGILQVTLEGNNTETLHYGSTEFCLKFTDIPEFDEYYIYEDVNHTFPQNDMIIRPIFAVCDDQEAENGHTFVDIFYPTALFIS